MPKSATLGHTQSSLSGAIDDMLKLYNENRIHGDPWHKVEYRQAICDCLHTLKWHRVLKDYNLETLTFQLEESCSLKKK
jgi:hypothetical protein